MEEFDFSGWATRNNVRCSDGRTIMKDAFEENNGKKVPLVWNHQHNDPSNILGHAMLENRDEGVYAYCKFNDTESGKCAKTLVQHGDVNALSIFANQLRHQGHNVIHGIIREVSLVLAGANPKAYIESVMSHGEMNDEEAVIYFYTGEDDISLEHSDASKPAKSEKKEEEKEVAEEAKEKKPSSEEDNKGGETVQEVFNTLNEKQKTVVYALIGQALADAGKDGENDDEGEDKEMKHNIFEADERNEQTYLSHADQENILNMAKSPNVGSLQAAITRFAGDSDSLKHGFDDIDTLFPDYKDVYPGAPELITRDQGWVSAVIAGVHKSPIARIRTRQTDIRDLDGTANLRGLGYKKGDRKINAGNAKLLSRTTDPQTVYRKDGLHRDDILDITDFDVVEYQFGIMKQNLNEEIATAIMISDGREEGTDYKISEDHIRSIWHDDDLYTIHTDVDIEAARAEIQGSNTSGYFGENYIYAEAIITAALYSHERYKGTGKPDFYCDPHLLNVMLLARDMNGRRIYSDVDDLAKALNVGKIYTAEQFAGKTRTTKDNKTKKLLGIIVNLNDYQLGAVKGGEITRFRQFDIDFNGEKMLLETRVSGALTRVYSAIALEEEVDPI